MIFSGLMIPFLGTTLGAGMVFFMKGSMNQKLEKMLLGFAAGVMIAASVWSLLIPSIEMTEQAGGIAWIPACVGFTFAGVLIDNTGITLSGAFALALGIAIQNFPEGTAVALPLVKEGVSKKRAFVIASMTAVVEPLFGVLAAVFARFANASIAILLAFAAGTMIYVVVEELIPQAHMGENGKMGTLGFVVGFLVMMILDVALG